MNEIRRIVEDVESAFAVSTYPDDFLETYDQMECLASRTGRETFLVRRKANGVMAVASCYNKALTPIRPDFQMLRELDHPGIPRYFEQYQNEQMLCIIREYIEGEPLSVYAAERQLTEKEITGIAIRLCGILEALHAHEPPIVHRDIKPENIIVRPDGNIALIDFDIARTVRTGEGTGTVFLGTRGYAPPEQYGFGQTDSRSDIFALGVLLRWMVTGSTRENRNIRMNRSIQRVIDRCTAFAPEKRYSNIGQVRQDLQHAGKPGRRISFGKMTAMFLAVLLILCAGFAAGRFTGWLQPTAPKVFQEPLMERAVRLQTGREKGPLTDEDLADVKRLYIYGTEAFAEPETFDACSIDTSTEGTIRTLDDLAMLPNLEELHIVHQGYVDTTGIAGKARLHTVELKHMRLSGVAAIADAPALRHAILFCTGLSDVTALENCPWLETLDIGLNNITTLRQIGFHPNVRNLGLMWLKMKDLEGIEEHMPKVQTVTLQHGSFGDLSGLKALPNLETVYVLQDQEDAVRRLFEGSDVQIQLTDN